MTEKKNQVSSVQPKADVMKMANEARAKANSLSDDKRADAFLNGMRLIYGGTNRIAAKVGRP